MNNFCSHEQILETIAALEDHTPGVWRMMKDLALVADPTEPQYEREQSAVVLALLAILPKLSVVASSDNQSIAKSLLLRQLRKAAKAEAEA